MAPSPKQSSTLHSQVVDIFGLAIVNGDMATGSTFTIDDLESRFGVSRSVVRETLRVLESKGMVQSRRRIGVQVLPRERWSLLDPTIIHWRLRSESGQMKAQLRSLLELRLAVEPEAARLAATRATLKQTSDLMAVAGQVWAAGQSGDMDAFIEADIRFHDVILTASQNELFSQLHSLLGEQLRGRAQLGLMPPEHNPHGLQAHMDVASAIQRRDADGAHDALSRIVILAIHEMSPIWRDDGLTPPTPSPFDIPDPLLPSP
ncbi:MAG: FadR family transcriptional regulator [Propionibacteriaceae bacterium]|nr:FadR family transcriptional regulator [Propionibacteriaceae bacterium]